MSVLGTKTAPTDPTLRQVTFTNHLESQGIGFRCRRVDPQITIHQLSNGMAVDNAPRSTSVCASTLLTVSDRVSVCWAG